MGKHGETFGETMGKQAPQFPLMRIPAQRLIQPKIILTVRELPRLPTSRRPFQATPPFPVFVIRLGSLLTGGQSLCVSWLCGGV